MAMKKKHYSSNSSGSGKVSMLHGPGGESAPCTLRNDSNATAGLPQSIVMHRYPSESEFSQNLYDDSMKGIDAQINQGVGTLRSIVKPRKA